MIDMPLDVADRPTRPSHRPGRRLLPAALWAKATGPSAVALAVWAASLPVAFAIPAALDADPFATRTAAMTLAAGGTVVALVVVLAWWRPSARVAGAAAGMCAGWVALTLWTALHGTPFGFGGLRGDMGRIAAAATRYSEMVRSADGIVGGIPAEYPPLYSWSIGRVSALLDVPAWRLVGQAEVLTTSAAIIVGFVLWRRLLPAMAALAVALACLMVFGDPKKAFELVVAAAFVPWALTTFAAPPRGRPSWPVAGAIGGIMVLTYQGYLLLGCLGVLALVVHTARGEANRRGYLLHVLGVCVVAFVIASWYVVPYVVHLVRHGGQSVADLYVSSSLLASPVQFLEPTPLGALQLVGVIGLFWFRRVTWWAAPMLCLALGTGAYWLLMMIRFALDGHTGFLHYTPRLLGCVLVAAGVLTVVQAAPALVARVRSTAVRDTGIAALVVVAVWGGYAYWGAAMPQEGRPSHPTFDAARAHAEPLPSGRRPRFAPDRPAPAWLPVSLIRHHVQAVLGPRARPVTLSYDDRLFAYLPWPGYTSVDRTSANTLSRWDDRRAALAASTRRTAAGGKPASLGVTEFGKIDVFVLRQDGTVWRWRDITFRPEWFGQGAFTVSRLPGSTMLAIRR